MANNDRAARARELLQAVSRIVEDQPGLTAPAVRLRARLKRHDGDKALELLERGGFVERRRADAEDTYYSVRPYRVSNETPRATFANTHAARQGGGG